MFMMITMVKAIMTIDFEDDIRAFRFFKTNDVKKLIFRTLTYHN